MAEKRTFGSGPYSNYTIEEKQALAAVVKECKKAYDEELHRLKGKTHWDSKRKRHVPETPKQGYLAKAVRSFYCNLKDAKNDDAIFKAAIKMATRCYEKAEKGELESLERNPKKRFRAAGGGRKSKAPEVRIALFEWFVDIRTSLSARLPRSLFILQARKLYDDWLKQHPDTPEDEKLRFSKCWMKNWQKEYGVSLKFPNKRYSISQADCVVRVEDYLKNIWRVRRYFIEKFGIDPPIINGDQMPLHRNESSGQATLAFKNWDTFVKENTHLSRERVTVFTQVATDESINLLPEFVFKGTGKRPPHINAPDGMKYQWAPKGSYRLEQILATIRNLPNRFNMFSHAGFAIYVLDDYSVHLMPEVREALWKRGYVLVIIGGGITGFVQVNDTHLHKELKKEYRQLESAKMLEKLEEDRTKIPSPNRAEMMSMLKEANAALKIDRKSAFKSVWVSNALDGSEDFLVSDRIIHLVGTSMRSFRTEMMSEPCPSSIKDVIKALIPPKGVKRANNVEGAELFDGEEEEREAGDSESESEEDPSIFDIDLAEDIPIEVEAQTEPANRMVGNTVALAGISSNEETNKDAIFLDKLKELLDGCETSTLFIPFRNQLTTTCSNARRAIKRRILDESKNIDE